MVQLPTRAPCNHPASHQSIYPIHSAGYQELVMVNLSEPTNNGGETSATRWQARSEQDSQNDEHKPKQRVLIRKS